MENNNRIEIIDNKVSLDTQKIDKISNRTTIMGEVLVFSKDQMLKIESSNKKCEKIYLSSYVMILVTVIVIAIIHIVKFLYKHIIN